MTIGERSDLVLISRTRAALDWWESTGLGPTSPITGGGAIAFLERHFSGLVDERCCLAMPSATSALQVALTTLGVGPGNEVICPAYDWTTTTSVVRSLGAVPILAPIEEDTLTIDPVGVKPLLTPRTRAVVATHLFGLPADVAAIRRVTDPIHIPVVEDAAQAIGSSIGGAPVGSLGAAAAFSFGPGKLIDAGGGGMLVTANRGDHQRAVQLSQHPTRHLLLGLPATTRVALSAYISSLTAIVAAHEMLNLDHVLADAKVSFESIRQGASGIGCSVLGLDPVRQSNRWRTPVRQVSDGDPARCGSSIVLAAPGAVWLPTSPPPPWIRSVRTAHLVTLDNLDQAC